MKKHFIFYLLVTIIVERGFSQNEYVLKDSILNFQISFPKFVPPQKDTLHLDDEREVFCNYWYHEYETPKGGARTYFVQHSVYPADYIHSDSSFQLIEGFLYSTAEEYADTTKYEELHSSTVASNGYVGKSFRLRKIATGEFFEHRAYLVENNLIEVALKGVDEGNWFQRWVHYYFDSFQVIDLTYNSKDYGFRIIEKNSYFIDFPAMPELINQSFDSDYGTLNMRIHLLEPKNATTNLAFTALETEYPDSFSVEDAGGLSTFYQRSMEGSTRSVDGQLLSTKDIMIAGFPGVEYEVEILDGLASIIHRCVLVGKKSYAFGVITTNKNENEVLERFLDSFKLLD